MLFFSIIALKKCIFQTFPSAKSTEHTATQNDVCTAAAPQAGKLGAFQQCSSDGKPKPDHRPPVHPAEGSTGRKSRKKIQSNTSEDIGNS